MRKLTELAPDTGYDVKPYKWDGRDFLIKPNGEMIAKIMEQWPDAEWIDGAEVHRDKYLAARAQEKATMAAKAGTISLSTDFEFQTTPYQHQLDIFVVAKDMATFALLMEQGTGKTKTTIDIAAYKFEAGEIDTLFVIAPTGVHINWIRGGEYEKTLGLGEIGIHMPRRIPLRIAEWNSGMGKRKLQSFRENSDVRSGHLTVVAMGIDALNTKAGQDEYKRILGANKCMVVIDESDTIASPSAKRSKFLHKESDDAIVRTILTGTPVSNGPQDVFSQFKFLDPNILGHATFTTFRAEYCKMGHFKNITGYKNLDKLKERIAGHSFRVLKQDCLDLPDKIYRSLRFDLSPEQRRVYDEFEKEFRVEYGGVEISEELAIVRRIRLHQIACGWFPGEDDDALQSIGGENPRIGAVIQACAYTPRKVIVWSKFRRDLEEIQERLGPNRAVGYHGAVGKAEREDNIDRYLNDDECRIMVANPKSAGRGFTWTVSDHSIWHSYDESLRDNEQANDRNHRIGQIVSPTYSYLEAIGTVDTSIVMRLKEKKDVSEDVLGDAASGFLEGVI